MRTEKFPLRISANTFSNPRLSSVPSGSAGGTGIVAADAAAVFRDLPFEEAATACLDIMEEAGACDAPLAFVFLVLMVKGAYAASNLIKK